MTDETTTVGAAGVSGAGGQPDPAVSAPATPPIEGEVTKLLAGFGEKFDALQKELRGLQGRQDKAENNFQQQLAKFNQIKAQGNLSDEQAMDVMQRGDAEAQRWAALEQKLDGLYARLESGGTQTNRQQEVTKVFESLGLDLKDVRVASALVKQYKDADEVELAAYRLQRELASSPNPNPSQSASMTGASTPPVNYDQLAEEYAQLAYNPSANIERMREIRKVLDGIK